MNLFLRLLPREMRDLVDIGVRLLANVTTKERRSKVVAELKAMLADGNVYANEWMRLGGPDGLNIFKKEPPRRKKPKA